MPLDPTPPMFVAGKLGWSIESDEPWGMTFWARATTFKYALGLRPRARDDDRKAAKLAEQNWDVLDRIARDALAEGCARESSASKSWKRHYDIDDSTFSRLLRKYESRLVR
jgi:hypothetical protein